MNDPVTTTPRPSPTGRLATTLTLVLFGIALATATWISGDHGFAVALLVFYAIAGGVAWWWSGRSGDVAALLRRSGDERQRGMDIRATAAAGVATAIFCLGAVIVQTVRDADPTPYALVCTVGGVSYTVALVWIRWRG